MEAKIENWNKTAERVVIYGVIDEVKKQTTSNHFMDAFDYLREKGFSNLNLNLYEKKVLKEVYGYEGCKNEFV